MKIRISMVPPEEDVNLRDFVESLAAVSGNKVDEKILQNILNDYIEISTSALDDLPSTMQESAKKYMETATRRFVMNLTSALKMSTMIGPGPLDAIEAPLKLSELKLSGFMFQLLAKIKSEKDKVP